MRVVLEPQGMAAVRDAEFEAMFGLRQSLLSDQLRRAEGAGLAGEPRPTRRALSAVLRTVFHKLSALAGIVPPERAGKFPVAEGSAYPGVTAMTGADAREYRRCEERGAFTAGTPATAGRYGNAGGQRADRCGHQEAAAACAGCC